MKQHNLDENLKTLTRDELVRLFRVAKDTVDILEKLFPGAPALRLLKEDQDAQAWALIQNIHKK